jgi:hypothetical protein
MPPRRRREGGAVPARSEERSSPRGMDFGTDEGTSILPRTPAFRETAYAMNLDPQAARIRAPTRVPPPAGDPGARSAARRASHRRSRHGVAFAPAPRPASSVARASGSRRAPARRAGRGSQVVRRGDAQHDQRNRHRLVPASSGAKKPHSRARIERSTGVPVRRFRLQKSASSTEIQRSAFPPATGRVDGGPACARSQGPA